MLETIMPDDYVLMTDISHHQGKKINFNKMRSMGVQVCGIKRSEGNYYADPNFDANWKGCEDADIIPFPYHFVVPWDDSQGKVITGEENAAYFLSLLKGYETPLPLAGDVEKGLSNTPEIVTSVVQKFYQSIGYPNINYTADWFWNARIKPWSGWKNSLLWVMSVPYFNSDAKTHYPNHELFLEYLAKGSKFPIMPRAIDGKISWTNWAIWQFSHQGKGRDYGLERDQPIDLDIVKRSLLSGIMPPVPTVPPVPGEAVADVVVSVGSDRYKGQAKLSKV